jgi:hypothetical protein
MKPGVMHSLYFPKQRGKLFRYFALLMDAVLSVSCSEGGSNKGHSYTQQVESLSSSFLP